jgi:hypothetical protein
MPPAHLRYAWEPDVALLSPERRPKGAPSVLIRSSTGSRPRSTSFPRPSPDGRTTLPSNPSNAM